MATSGSPSAPGPDVLVDTSAAVALLVSDHEGHRSTLEALNGQELGLAGHAWFETYSVLTRLPGAARRDATTVTALLDANFPHRRFLDQDAAAEVASSLAHKAISGGAVYDALVAAVSERCGLPLVTRDRRALATYRHFDIEVRRIV